MNVAAHSHHSMDLWGPRRATSLKQARARTALVHILRLLFTVGAVLSAGLLIGTVVNSVINHPQGVAPQSSAASVTVLGPRFDGFDANDKPYTLTAETAKRRKDNVGLIDLVNPKLENAGSSSSPEDAPTTVQAREGVWNADAEVLDLSGDVVMTDAAGYTFTSQKTRMYVKDNRVEGQVPLTGVGPIGEVKADGYEVRDDGNKIILKGHVWTKLNGKKREAKGGGR